MKNLVIVSAGKLGREVHNWAVQAIRAGSRWQIKGFLDDRQNSHDGIPGLPPILGPVDSYQIQPDDCFLCAIGDPVWKRKYQSELEQRGAQFATLVHPTALIGINVEIGPGTIICPFCHVSCDVRMGRGVFIGTHSGVAHDTRFGDFCQISGSCEINGSATLDEGVFLGSHATILPDARVEKWSYVGAHSVVLRKVKAYQKVFGVPAVVIGTTRETTKGCADTGNQDAD